MRLLLAAMIIFSLPLSAQTIRASLYGRVLDPQNSPVPGATVRATHLATGTPYTFTSNEGGGYDFPRLLQFGDYRIEVEAPGFAKLRRDGVNLVIDQRAQVDLRLTVGSVSDTVEVQATAPLLETSNATPGQFISNRQVQTLPLPNLSPLHLIYLAPGVSPQGNVDNRSRPGTNSTSNFSINGSRGVTNEMIVDGLSANFPEGGSGGSGTAGIVYFPSMEATEELKVLNNTFSAEYGKSGGGVVTLTLKSGTNQFRGSLFEFFRNNQLNARDYFDRTGKAAILRDNTWGAAIGGRILRDKLFYFGTYEQQKVRGSGGTRIAVVPTTAQVAGITNPAARALFQATQGFSADSGTVSNPAPLGSNSVAYSGKIDYNITQKDTLWGRYAYQESESRSPGLTFISSNLPTNGASSTNTPQTITLGYTRIFSPTLVLNQLGGFLRSNPNFTPLVPISAASVSFQNALAEIGSWSGLPQGRTQNVYNSLTTLTKTSGNHTIKGGYNFERIQANSVFDSNTRGSFTFANFEQFQLGIPVIYSQRFGGSIRGNRVSNQGIFLQDDWRIRRNLTLNLGVRLEIAGGVSEVNGLLSNLNLDRQAALGGAGTGCAAVRIFRSTFVRSVGRAIASRRTGFAGLARIAVASWLQSGQPVHRGSWCVVMSHSSLVTCAARDIAIGTSINTVVGSTSFRRVVLCDRPRCVTPHRATCGLPCRRPRPHPRGV